MPTNQTENKPKSVLHILSLLQAYEENHAQANEAWKKSLWNIYKGRHSRKRNNLGYVSETYCCASDVREDLEPQITLVQQPPSSTDQTDIRPFVAVQNGVVQKKQQDTLNPNTDEDDNNVPDLVGEQGLRNRRNKQDDETTAWTMEQNDKEGNDKPDSSMNPLELLAGGFPPKELKEAQQQAKQALLSYIEAANLLMELEQQLSKP